MKLLCLLLVCGLAVAIPTNEWEEFKKTYGKSYANSADEEYRKTVFEDKLQFIAEHNARFDQGKETYTVGMNKFGDMTQEEIVESTRCLPKGPPPPKGKLHQLSGKANAVEKDWRDDGAVSGVKDQGQCGSCWAFSTTGSLEASHFINTGYMYLESEQELVDCSRDYGNGGCNGGWQQNAFQYIVDKNGINSEEVYPYEALDGACRRDETHITATCEGYINIDTGDEAGMTDAIANIGPVSVSIDSTHPGFSMYQSGVYYDPACDPNLLSHAVLAVGYGEENGMKYYIVKNSWADTWGDAGYIKMARDKDNNCGIATNSVYPTGSN
uniref:Putative cathepsin L n=1 Tax=Crangon crangon TaxID=491138 RepID=A0A2Z4BWD2_CRACN|nr:putative cathepsin L [Crangon crangon]